MIFNPLEKLDHESVIIIILKFPLSMKKERQTSKYLNDDINITNNIKGPVII